jgi:hypothetical protein
MAMAATINAFVVELKPRDGAAAARGDEAAAVLVAATAADGAPMRSGSAFDSFVVAVLKSSFEAASNVAPASSFEVVSPGHCVAALEVSFAVSIASSAPQPGQVR